MTEQTPHPSTVPHGRKPGLPVFAPTECICGGAWPCPWTPKETEEPQTKKRGFAVEIAGLPPIIFLGWRSTHGAVRIAALSKPVSRALIEARATIDGSLRSAAAILRPGDRFDRETGKRIALARLVASLIPELSGMPLIRDCKLVKIRRSQLFKEIWKRTHKGALPVKPRTTFDLTAAMKGIAAPTRTWNWFYSRYPEPAPIGKVISVDTETPGEILTTHVGLAPPTTTPVKIQGKTATSVIIDEKA